MDDEVLFQAVVTPHRSLSAAGLRRLILAICLLSLAVTTGCYLAGAWPVIGFSGVEIGLAVLLLRLNARRARRREVISLTPSTVAVERTDEAGRKSVRTLRAAWLNVVLEERAARVPGLFLRNRAEQVEVAREIGETEKRSLHADLRDALYRWRHPVFDNPQLRD